MDRTHPHSFFKVMKFKDEDFMKYFGEKEDENNLHMKILQVEVTNVSPTYVLCEMVRKVFL